MDLIRAILIHRAEFREKLKELGEVFTDAGCRYKAYTGQVSNHRETQGMIKYANVSAELYFNWLAVDTLEPETIFAIIKAFEIDTKYFNFYAERYEFLTRIIDGIKTKLTADAALKEFINNKLQDLLRTQIPALKELRMKNPNAIFDGRFNDELSLIWQLILSTITFILDNGFT